MEEEKFISGYCRALDASRTVCAVLTDGRPKEADCAYGNCPHEPVCAIAQQLNEWKDRP